MPSMIDFAKLGLRDAFDFAIMIEEDAQQRYRQLAALLGDDPGGAGEVCRSMIEREGQHRDALVERRARRFRDAPPRFEISVLEEGIERPDVDDDDLPATAREALEVALAAEWRAHAFFDSAIPHLSDPETRAFFQQLREEEVEHARLLEGRISRLPAASGPGSPRARSLEPWSGSPIATYPDRALLEEALPRFDAATRAVAQGVIVSGLEPGKVAEALGVSRRTVRTKLARFLELARRHVAAAAVAAAVTGCAGSLPQVASPAHEIDPAATQAGRAIPDRSVTEATAMAGRAAREHEERAEAARRVHDQVAARMPAESPGLHRRLSRAILAEADQARLDPLVVLALIHTESAFDPQAVSEAGARGLMQLLEPTMRRELERSGLPCADPHDPVANVQAGVRYLRRLMDTFGSLDLALMAYNAGPNRIREHLRRGAVPERFHDYPRRVHGEVRRLRLAMEAAPPGAAPVPTRRA